MLEDFKRALARVQSDYGFYIGCQTDPALALAGYDLSAERARGAERSASGSADMLKRGVGSEPPAEHHGQDLGIARLGQPRGR